MKKCDVYVLQAKIKELQEVVEFERQGRLRVRCTSQSLLGSRLAGCPVSQITLNRAECEPLRANCKNAAQISAQLGANPLSGDLSG